jgi:hypothetical protein
LVDSGNPGQTARGGHLAVGYRGQGGLVDLGDDPGSRYPLGDVLDVVFRRLGEGCGEIRDGARVAQRGIHRAVQLKGGGQRPRAAQLDLERAFVALQDFFHDVEVAGEHRLRPGHVPARVLGQPPAAGRDLDRDVYQQGGGAPGYVGARAATWQLWQVRKPGQFSGDDPHRLRWIGTRHRPDAGRAARWPWFFHRASLGR